MITALTKTPNFYPTDSFSGVNGRVHDNRRKIGLLAGNDISTLISLNHEVRKMVTAGYKPVIYMVDHRPSKKEKAHQPQIQSLAFYERYLTNNVVFPIIDQMETPSNSDGSPRDDVLYTPKQLAEMYGLNISYIDDINSDAFVDEVWQETNMPLIISIRCYQIAHERLIQAQTKKEITLSSGQKIKGAIWNMHPGKLPEYQGILGPLYAMDNLQRTYAWTLHEMIYDPNDKNKGIDKGPVITQTTAPIDYSKPAIDLYLDLAKPAADMLYDRVEDFFRGQTPVTPQNKFKGGEKAQYYSHPDPKFFNDNERWPTVLARLVQLSKNEGFTVNPKVAELVSKGHTEPEIVDYGIMAELIPSLFASNNDSIHEHLVEAIDRAITDWETHKNRYIAAHSKQHPNSNNGVVDALLVSGKTLPNGYQIEQRQPHEEPQGNNRALG